MAAVHDAGLTQIDHLIITHWHGDHFGGLAALAPQIPIREFIDHGQNMQPGPAADEFIQKTYPQLISAANAKHTIAKAGDKIRLGGVDILVVTSAGQVLKTPLPGAGKPNPYCAEYQAGRQAIPRTRNRSASTLPSANSAPSTWATSPRTRSSR